MTQEEIEYNKKCAEFLGWHSEAVIHDANPKHPNLSEEYFRVPDDIISPFRWLKPRHMEFHSDWNWIMEVVEAIEELDVVASFQIEQPTIFIWVSSEDSTFKGIEIDINIMSKKEAVVQAINQFLIWYDEQSRKA